MFRKEQCPNRERAHIVPLFLLLFSSLTVHKRIAVRTRPCVDWFVWFASTVDLNPLEGRHVEGGVRIQAPAHRADLLSALAWSTFLPVIKISFFFGEGFMQSHLTSSIPQNEFFVAACRAVKHDNCLFNVLVNPTPHSGLGHQRQFGHSSY